MKRKKKDLPISQLKNKIRKPEMDVDTHQGHEHSHQCQGSQKFYSGRILHITTCHSLKRSGYAQVQDDQLMRQWPQAIQMNRNLNQIYQLLQILTLFKTTF